MYQMLLKRPAPQLPVWQFANMILKPFADFEGSKEDAAGAGFDLELTEGLGKTGGSFEILATAENGKINVNDPQLQDANISRNNVASLSHSLFAARCPAPTSTTRLVLAARREGRTPTPATIWSPTWSTGGTKTSSAATSTRCSEP